VQKNKRFKASLKEVENDPRLKNMPLSGFLIMPVQRIPRYLLLLKELLKCTPPDHVDYSDLVMAHSKIAEVALDVNEAERNAQNLNTIYKIQTILGGQVEIVEPHRKLLRHGSVQHVVNGKKKKSYLILFNDMLLLAKQKGYGTLALALEAKKKLEITENDLINESMKVILQCKVISLTVEYNSLPFFLESNSNPEQDTNLESSSTNLETKFQFGLRTCNKYFVIECDSLKAREEWIVHINRAIDKQTERSHPIPGYLKD